MRKSTEHLLLEWVESCLKIPETGVHMAHIGADIGDILTDARNILKHATNILADLEIVLVSNRGGRVKMRWWGWFGAS